MTTFKTRTPARALAAAAVIAALAACSTSTTPSSSPEPSSPPEGGAALSGQITVFAAASLTDVFTALAEDFQAEHPGTSIVFSFAGSSDLATQIVEGAPADVFASANEAQMQVIVDADQAEGEPAAFATNYLMIAVPPGNPAGIASFEDLARDDVSLVVCAPQVPCGAATKKLEEALGVALSPVSEEHQVTDVLGKVSSDQADAGLVYITDVAGADGAVEGIAFEGAEQALNIYPIATVSGSANLELAQAFVDFVLGERGQQALAAAGFGTP